jgi:hypothetical protein
MLSKISFLSEIIYFVGIDFASYFKYVKKYIIWHKNANHVGVFKKKGNVFHFIDSIIYQIWISLIDVGDKELLYVAKVKLYNN